jgi:6-phosphogluconate dehydrogenase
MMTPEKFGIIGLGVMGQNLALNIERNGAFVVGYDRSAETRARFGSGPAARKRSQVANDIGAFIDALERSRHILLMVPAGDPVDAAIQELKPWLQPGDLIIDGGNSYFLDTERRSAALAAEGLHFMGLGASGGAEGALWGPSIMAGRAGVGRDSGPGGTEGNEQVDEPEHAECRRGDPNAHGSGERPLALVTERRTPARRGGVQRTEWDL